MDIPWRVWLCKGVGWGRGSATRGAMGDRKWEETENSWWHRRPQRNGDRKLQVPPATARDQSLGAPSATSRQLTPRAPRLRARAPPLRVEDAVDSATGPSARDLKRPHDSTAVVGPRDELGARSVVSRSA
jgi:hypothetical protein